jgi:cobalt-zinc-cadmium efflux system outer membrane protein
MRFIAVLLLAGCSSPYDRSWVDRQTRELAGFDIGEEAPSMPPKVTSLEELSADDAVAIALWNSARFRVELARLGYSRADLAEAGTLPNPVLSVLFPVATRTLEASLTYPFGTLLQMPMRVAAAKLDVERTARAMVEVALDLIRDVRFAAIDADAANRRIAVRARLNETWTHVTDLTEVRLRAGDATDVELRAARAEAIAAADEVARAKNEATIAKERMRRLLGLGADPRAAALTVKHEEARAVPPPAREQLEAAALAARPDVRAADVAVDAAAKRLGWERARILQLFARLDAKPVGSLGGAPIVFPPGLTAEIPIFGWNKGGRARANAELQQATMRCLAVREDVITDVRVARERVEQAAASLIAFRDRVAPLHAANVRAVTAAYESGSETYLMVLDTVRRAQEAELRAIDVEADLARAHAMLARAVGAKVDR